MNKIKIILLVLVCGIISACQKDVDNISAYKNESISYSNSSMLTGEGAEGIMELAPETPNPYTLENMQAALMELQNQNSLGCDASIFNIRVTHKYIRFEPQDSIQMGLLIQDTSLILFDYPLDRKILRGGTYYRDPSVPEGQPNYQWTCVSVEKIIPQGVPFVVISDLYIPEEDENLVQYYDTDIDGCISLLIEEALRRTGNLDTTSYYGGITDGGEMSSLGWPSKWTPKGRIRLTDNILNNNTGLNGVKIKVHRWFEVRECLTNNNGDFNILHKFRYPVNYSIKWERNDFQIRSGSFGQAYFNGPYKKGDWNLDIVSGISWHYGHVHRAAIDYYYNNPTGLRRPPLNGFLGMRLTFGVYDECDRTDYRHWQRLWFGPEIRMYSKWNSCDARSSQDQYRTAIHELAHASHFNMSHWHFRNSANMMQESWAVGVAWVFEKLKYPNPIDLQNLMLQNAPLINGVRFDIVNWGERQYTPLVIDLIDDINQRANQRPNNGGNTDYPIDNVSSYNIRTIEDALNTRITMEAWRDALKNTKPTGISDAQVDELFNNYIPLQ